jgi:hypothetical protein
MYIRTVLYCMQRGRKKEERQETPRTASGGAGGRAHAIISSCQATEPAPAKAEVSCRRS